MKLAVKDLIDMKGEVTSAGSQYRAFHASPARQDAACLRLARSREDVVFVGKTNLAELAMGTTGINHYFGTPKNPVRGWRTIPGGSSSGSAVAVASGAADVAIGTDTAGSIRVPAACTGTFGLKTTYGLVSLKGVYPLSPKHLDSVGPMAATLPNLVKGMGLLQGDFAGKHARAKAAKATARSIRVGRLYVPGTHAAMDKAIDDALARAGFTVVRLDETFVKRWEQAQKDGYKVAMVDGWLANRDFAGSREISILAKAAMLLGNLDYPDRYAEALSRRTNWRRTLAEQFTRVDVIALPTLQRVPKRIPLLRTDVIFEAEMLNSQNTVAVNYAGNPALAVPVPMQDDPTLASLQLIGPRQSEAQLLNAARFLVSQQE